MAQETRQVDEILIGGNLASGLVNQFLSLYYQLHPNGINENPSKTLRQYLDRIEHLCEDYYLCENWLFLIRNGEIEDISLVPTLSYHARQRFIERFPSFNIRERRRHIALDIICGKELSKNERLRLGIKGDRRALQCQNRVYVIVEHTVVTCLDI